VRIENEAQGGSAQVEEEAFCFDLGGVLFRKLVVYADTLPSCCGVGFIATPFCF